MENKNNNVLLTVLGVCTLLVALVGASFAYFTATEKSEDQNIQTGHLEVQSVLNATGQSEIKPTTFATATADTNDDIAKFVFNVTGENTTVTGATYDIQLMGAASGIGEDTTKGGTVADIEYALYKGDAATGTLVKTGSFSTITAATTISDGTNSLTASTDDDYTLYVYIKETNTNQDNLQNVTISATMNAIAKTPSA